MNYDRGYNRDFNRDFVREPERGYQSYPGYSNSQDYRKDNQTHVHEIEGIVKLAEENNERHDHRFATVSTEAIPIPGGGHCGHNHKHAFYVNTDFFDHHHEVAGETGPAIEVGNGKHVHFAEGQSTFDDGHFHGFQFATLIENPLR